MPNPLQAKVIDLWRNPFYRDVVKKIEEIRPLVISYDPKTNNVEQIKFNSAQLQLHDLVLLVLKPSSTGEP